MDLRAQILAADDLPKEKASAPEWGVEEIFIRQMTGEEREKYEAGLFKADGSQQLDHGVLRARLVVLTAVDAEGKRVFSDDDVAAVAGKSSKVLMRLAEVAQRLNGLSREAEEAAEKK